MTAYYVATHSCSIGGGWVSSRCPIGSSVHLLHFPDNESKTLLLLCIASRTLPIIVSVFRRTHPAMPRSLSRLHDSKGAPHSLFALVILPQERSRDHANSHNLPEGGNRIISVHGISMQRRAKVKKKIALGGPSSPS